ncbi:MAG: GNAT family N-acetyltransferase [Caldilineaceae bacterium]
MIEEIRPIQPDATLFPGAQLTMVTTSIAAGNTNGQLWRAADADADTDRHEQIYLLWDQGNNVFYLAGGASPDAIRTMAAQIDGAIRQAALQQRLIYFKIHPLTPALAAAIPDLFHNIPLHEMHKRFYRFEQEAAPVLSAAVDGVHYRRIDAAFLGEQHGNIEAVRGEVAWMWASPAAFQAHGFGSAALVGDVIVCWCTAEYVSARMCGIGIETVPEFQGKGIATATAAHFVGECLRRGIVPHWECDGQNVGSVRVAEKVGFQILQKSRVWGGNFQNNGGKHAETNE